MDVVNRDKIFNDIVDELVLKDIVNLHDYDLIDIKTVTYAILSMAFSGYVIIDVKEL
jgi:hypothetical protein